MCGITFILSKNNTDIIKDLMKSMQLIQNRGYDSMGICYYDEYTNKYEIEKNASTDCFNMLNNNIMSKNITSHIGFGHTRWATHGKITHDNTHPHISQHQNIILVHNGIISNYTELKNELLENNFTFYSETDTEVIANLIEYYLIYMNNDIEKAIENSLKKLEGTWALVIIYTKELDTYYITRRGSPLLLGTNDNYTVCTSEVNGFAGLIYDYIPLKDNTIVKITKQDYHFLNESYQENGNSVKNGYEIKKVPYEDIVNNDNQYPHWMIKEIMEQPDTIQKAYNYGGRLNNYDIKLGGLDRISNIVMYIEYIILIGCGTSYNAALIGEQYFKEISIRSEGKDNFKEASKKFILVKSINACEFSINDLPNIKNKAKILCVFLSQSGETIDVYNCLKICKQNNCVTMGIVNAVDSLIAREVDCGVYLNAGPEISVASTKSFTSMVIVLSLIQMWFYYSSTSNSDYNSNHNSDSLQKSNNNIINAFKINNLTSLHSTIINLLYDIEFLKSLNDKKNFIMENNINNIFILGKNKLYPIACEGSLKIKEVTYIHSEGFSAGSLKHGPFALLDKTNLTFLLIDYTDVEYYQNLRSTYHEINARNTNLIVITNSENVVKDLNILPENYIMLYSLDYYNEIIFNVTLQYLAYIISIERGINPDKPRNLAKVVTVE